MLTGETVQSAPAENNGVDQRSHHPLRISCQGVLPIFYFINGSDGFGYILYKYFGILKGSSLVFLVTRDFYLKKLKRCGIFG